MSPSEFDELEADIERAHQRRHKKEMLWTVCICLVALLVVIASLLSFWIESSPLFR